MIDLENFDPLTLIGKPVRSDNKEIIGSVANAYVKDDKVIAEIHLNGNKGIEAIVLSNVLSNLHK
jgi:hypothetical protein